MTNANAQNTASYWVTRLYSGEMTAQEERELKRWRAADIANEQAFEEALAVWDLTAQLYLSDATEQSNEPEQITLATQPQREPKLWRKLAVAASIAFVSVLVAVNIVPSSNSPKQRLVNAPATPTLEHGDRTLEQTAASRDNFQITRQNAQLILEQTRTFTTEVGEVSHIQLDDGSEVSLNTDSAIRVTMRNSERHVELLNGEAFFDVAKDANRPFIVATAEQQITVLGTAFNVRQRSDEQVLKVAVIEGRVAVKRRSEAPESKAETASAAFHNAEQFLLAGDIAAFSDDSKLIQQQQFEKAKVSQTWRRGIVRFDDAPLKSVIKELNRYRQRKIELRGSSVESLKISGVFHLKNGDAILSAIAATLPVQVLNDDTTIYISAR